MGGKNSSGFTKVQSTQGEAFSGDFLDQKSKSSLFLGGGGAMVTDWCIIFTNLLRHKFIKFLIILKKSGTVHLF